MNSYRDLEQALNLLELSSYEMGRLTGIISEGCVIIKYDCLLKYLIQHRKDHRRSPKACQITRHNCDYIVYMSTYRIGLSNYTCASQIPSPLTLIPMLPAE